MHYPPSTHPNRLAVQRRKLGYSQRRVVRLLGHKSHAGLSLYESGKVLPTLATALRLELILRVPLAQLFPDLYERQLLATRTEDARVTIPTQRMLFDQIPNPQRP